MSLRRSSRVPSAPSLISTTSSSAPRTKRPSSSQPPLTTSLPALKRFKSAPAKPAKSLKPTTTAAADALAPAPLPILPEKASVLAHPPLTFSFGAARSHLERTDGRWGPLMNRLRCKPYQDGEGEPFNPFM